MSDITASAISSQPSAELQNAVHSGTSERTSYRWNGFDSWGAKVADYLKSGFVTPLTKPGFANCVPHFQTFGSSSREAITQYDDGETLVAAGQLYSVADLAAAFRRLREETAFVIPETTMVVDPRVPGRAFLAIEKIDCTDGSSLEYQITGENPEDCLRLVGEIKELLAQARDVLHGEFFVNLENPANWGLTDEGIARARSRWPLTQSDLIILLPIH
ncbi:MAG: hypothetical protein KGS72_04415 [Cyanobacteria bacterium REEB67]|nr:hypothetical protein [Cyanobacteria bacterium REEB67]